GAFPMPPQGILLYPEGDLTPLMKQARLVLEVNNARLKLIDLSTNSERWPQPLALGAVPQNAQYNTFLNQQTQGSVAQANIVHNPNAKFRRFQAKGNLIVVQLGAMVYAL